MFQFVHKNSFFHIIVPFFSIKKKPIIFFRVFLKSTIMTVVAVNFFKKNFFGDGKNRVIFHIQLITGYGSCFTFLYLFKKKV